jgi:hypothetical protein
MENIMKTTVADLPTLEALITTRKESSRAERRELLAYIQVAGNILRNLYRNDEDELDTAQDDFLIMSGKRQIN